ncbi:Eco57I restriction-modification methylase domain-containing protein [Bhargavaea beijingensis]|uniref:site-specific DNA-methyltransferase (adenine-specific) n=1 Tax=Bhargavaea beijingensis TaxID=426756 RepID=A0ABX9ZFU1_9BACL|nr:TaqI-like C-terminal specificity domain-containing protein [Bhargavaea beijingensis]RSK36620.1 hypothetical protein EJA12_02410 [Bhargavaea beijingensis]
MLNKERLISELKMIHKKVVVVYKQIFEYKYLNDSNFQKLIDTQYQKENKNTKGEKKIWNESYFHRSAYTLLNKILFIRICEDKGFMLNDEDKVMGEEVNHNAGQKLSMIGLQKWTNLISNYSLTELMKFAFKDMNKSYSNISLYKEDMYDWLIPKHDDIALKFTDTESFLNTPYKDFEFLLKEIIEILDTSRYDFGESADNVLGDVYEKFMDRETRKALGQFYTPDFVIEYILGKTVKNADIVTNPFIKVLDPACGSGHFLIMAYDLLKKKFMNGLSQLRTKYANTKYEIKVGDSTYFVSGQEYWTERYLHYHLLKHCIFGADIDGFALQITTINLLLKDLDNFITDELNIIEGDSLVRWEKDYEWEKLANDLKSGDLLLEVEYKDRNGQEKTLSPSFDEAYDLVRKGSFWSNDFDYIIGNPPYGLVFDSGYKAFLENNYGTFQRNNDIYVAFISRGLEVLKTNSKLSYIVPNSYLNGPYFKRLRKEILTNTKINELVDYGNNPVFDDANVYSSIFNISKESNLTEEYEFNFINVIKSNETFNYSSKLMSSLKINRDSFKPNKNSLTEKLYSVEKTVDDLCFVKDVGFNYWTVGRGKKRGDSIGARVLYNSEEKENRDDIPFIKGRDITKRGIRFSNNYLKSNYRDLLNENDVFRFSPEFLSVPKKIVYRQTSNKIIAYIDEDGHFLDKTVHVILFKDKAYEKLYSYEYMYFLLNSNLFDYLYKNLNDEEGRAFAQIKTYNIKKLPVPELNKDKINLIREKYSNLFRNNFYTFDLKEKRIIERFYEKQVVQDHRKIEQLLFEEEFNYDLYEYYNLNISEVREIEKSNDLNWENKLENKFALDESSINPSEILYYKIKNRDKFVEELSTILPPKKFMEEHVSGDKSISELASEYNVEEVTILLLRELYANKYGGNQPWEFYNLNGLITLINKYLSEMVLINIKDKRQYVSTTGSLEVLYESLSNVDELIDVLKLYQQNKKAEVLIKQILDENSDTFSKFLKDKMENKKTKDFVKYDTGVYGVSDWSDEVHKKYFIDAINYFTSSKEDNFADTVFSKVKITKKKAETALKFLHVLDFEDKEDYLEILTDKVSKAFD